MIRCYTAQMHMLDVYVMKGEQTSKQTPVLEDAVTTRLALHEIKLLAPGNQIRISQNVSLSFQDNLY